MCPDSEISGNPSDKFKETFKKYKNCKNISEFQQFKEIFDPISPGDLKCTKRNAYSSERSHTPGDAVYGFSRNFKQCKPLTGLRDPSDWEIFDFEFPKGLIFLKNPFTTEGQRYWITKCLKDYPKPPHVTNIDNLHKLKNIASQSLAFSKETITNRDHREKFYKDLRWLTFGYHHNWDTKVYTEENKCEFPKDLYLLTKYLAVVLGFDDFRAEAAIVNYYHMDSTLSGHQDRSEKYQTAPLFSISFGQKAVFLIGGKTKEEAPQPIYLTSGDIVIMSGESRLSYHGVPKILPTSNSSWCSVEEEKDSGDESCNLGAKRIKTNPKIRDGCELCSIADEFDKVSQPELIISQCSSFCDYYIDKSRINLNVRQVLFPGQKSLEDDLHDDVKYV